MRVLYWMDRFWPSIGGAQIVGARLAVELKERGHELIVVTGQEDLGAPRQDRYAGVPVRRFPFRAMLAAGSARHVLQGRREVAALKRAFAPDLVHIYLIGLSTFFHLDTADVHPTPLLVTLNGALSDDAAAPEALLGQTLRAADWVTGCSASVVAQTRRQLPAVARRSSLVYNGWSVPPLLPAPLPLVAPRVLCLGRLVHQKGFDLALAAFAALTRCFRGARLLVAGDGPARPALERHSAALGLTGAVDFLGWISPEAVPALINQATLVVVPSRHEAFGGVAAEAALMARPVVATRVGGLPEVITHRATGLLVEPEDPAALADAIAFLLSHPETAEQFGQAGRRQAQERFALEPYVDAYDALYRRLTARAP